MRYPVVITSGLLLFLTLNNPAFSQSNNLQLQPVQAANKQLNNQVIPRNLPVVITLQRTACFGACPMYKLTIFGDGKVVYEGERFVKVTGKRTGRISTKAVRQLIAEFTKVDYFSLANSYTGGPTDLPSAITSFRVGRQQKSVNHYLGSPNAPKQLTDLENKIDLITNSQQWTGVKPNVDDNTAQLQANKKLWNQQKLNSYRYTLQRSCFCLPEATQPVEIAVINGKTVGITANGQPVKPELFNTYDSVPKLFAVIQDAINRNAESLQVKYHPTLGYPTEINIDYQAQLADEELFLKIDNLQGLR